MTAVDPGEGLFRSSVIAAMRDRVERAQRDSLHSICTHRGVPYGRSFTQYRTDGMRVLWSHPDWLRAHFPDRAPGQPVDPLHALTGIPVYRVDG